MSEYIEGTYTESGYIDGDTSTVTETATCDLTSLVSEFNQIDLSILSLDDKLTLLWNSINSLISTVSSLATKTDITNMSQTIILPSLNGNGSEYKDGTMVKVVGRDVVYSVERSYHSLYSDNGYTVHYDLVSADGYKLTVPEALLTKYVSVA